MIGAELRRAREAKGLTQEGLSFATGIDRAYISLIELGRVSPTLDRFIRLARAVGVKPSVLLARAERAAEKG